ncbi:MAG: MarR family transcriptional regulator, partial [Pseudomonadota bacterium]
MVNAPPETLAIGLFSEVMALEHILRHRIAKALPKGMELSHFVLLNHLAHVDAERTPAQLAQAFSLSRGAMTNTLSKLEMAGYIHIRPDWDDARRKQVGISTAGKQARDAAFSSIAPVL